MIKKKAVSAMIWTFVGQIGSTGISSVFILIFARFMPPSDFGVFASGALLMSLTAPVAGLGLATALVQRHSLDTRSLSTAFWISFGASALLGSLMVAFAGLIALLLRIHGLVTSFCRW